MRVGLEKARLYYNGIGVTWKGDRVGQKKEVLQRIAKRTRHYSVKRTKLQSACASGWCAKRSKYMLFLTATFAFEPTEVQAARIWDLFLNSLRNTYNVKTYIWVKERQNSGRLHYHILIDRNRIDIKDAQQSFNTACNNIVPNCTVSINSLRLGTNPIVKTIEAVTRYLSKYISKTDNQYQKKAYGYSNLELYRDMSIDDLMQLVIEKGLQFKVINVSEMFSVYFFKDLTAKIYLSP